MRIRKYFKIKKTILLIFTFLTMLGVCSCETKNEKEKKKQTDQEVVAEMKGYLYDKYGYIDYEFVSFLRSSTWGDPYDLMVLTTSYRGNDEIYDIVGSNAILHFYLYVKEDSLENKDLKELDFRANCTWLICIDDENFNKIQEDNFRDYRKLGTAYQKVY